MMWDDMPTMSRILCRMLPQFGEVRPSLGGRTNVIGIPDHGDDDDDADEEDSNEEGADDCDGVQNTLNFTTAVYNG